MSFRSSFPQDKSLPSPPSSPRRSLPSADFPTCLSAASTTLSVSSNPPLRSRPCETKTTFLVAGSFVSVSKLRSGPRWKLVGIRETQRRRHFIRITKGGVSPSPSPSCDTLTFPATGRSVPQSSADPTPSTKTGIHSVRPRARRKEGEEGWT